jgi:8-oxo-dGTP pyrophosphatase MutT (NUDIX family)
MASPRILDPLGVPIVGRDEHLPAVPPDRLTADALRWRFQHDLPWQPEFLGDGRIGAERAPAHAAVLIPLIEHVDGLRVLLTRRTDHLRDHAGQVSFPGGRAELEDANPAATALREAQEEVGLHPGRVELIGQMPTYTTVTHFIVTPVVGLVRGPFDLHGLVLDHGEVAEVFQVPLAFLMNPAHHQRHLFSHDGVQRQFLSIPWKGTGSTEDSSEYFIWGATAAMLRNLYRFLSVT